MIALVVRDLALRFGRWGGVALPLLFFLLVANLFPFAVGPEPKLLAQIAGGIMWVAALLAALMPIDTLFEPDRADGTLDLTTTAWTRSPHRSSGSPTTAASLTAGWETSTSSTSRG